jgi:hypothetical protein
MEQIFDSIGTRFENFIQENFPGLENTTKDIRVPDFFHPSGLWIEVKIGNQLWGPRIKEYQIERFKRLKEPLIYALGLHDFDRAKERLEDFDSKERQEILEREMNINEVYLVSQEIVEKVWNKESRINDRRTMVYCMVKRAMFRNIIRERKFRKGGKLIESAQNFYGFNRKDYLMHEPTNGDIWGSILHKRNDSRAIGILEDYGVCFN